MPKLPRVTGQEVLRALKRAGFEEVRIRGSHHFLVHPGDHTRWATVPVHSGEVLLPETLSNILKTSKLTVEELIELL